MINELVDSSFGGPEGEQAPALPVVTSVDQGWSESDEELFEEIGVATLNSLEKVNSKDFLASTAPSSSDPIRDKHGDELDVDKVFADDEILDDVTTDLGFYL